MKKLLLLLITIGVSKFLTAQEEFKPGFGEIGVGLNASGVLPILLDPTDETFSVGLNFKYTLNDRFQARLNLLFGADNVKDEVEKTSPSYSSVKEKSNQNSFVFSPGIEYHFGGTNRLDPYMGFEIGFGRTSRLKTESIEVETFGNNSITSTLKNESPGTTLFNLNYLVGFNFFVFDRFSVGLETGFGYGLDLTKGEDTSFFSNGSTTVSSSSDIKKSIYGIESFPVTCNLVYYFGDF